MAPRATRNGSPAVARRGCRLNPHLAALLALAALALCRYAAPELDPRPPAATRTAVRNMDRVPGGEPVPDGKRALRDAAYLAGGIGPRPSGTGGEEAALAYAAQVLAGAGWQVQWQRGIPMAPSALRTANVVATHPHPKPGASAVVLVGAHVDSIRLPGGASPGGNDNASGVAVLLEAARVLAPRELPYRLVFVAFGGEESVDGHPDHHHYGSRRLAAQWSRDGTMADLRLMVSLDMVGRGVTLELRTAGPPDRRASALALRSARRLGLQMTIRGDQRGSDHEPFAARGAPALWLYRSGDGDHHTSADTPERLAAAPLEQTCRLLLDVLSCPAPPAGGPPSNTREDSVRRSSARP